MVTDEAWLPVTLFFDGSGRELKGRLVLDQVVGQDYPELAFDELGELLSEEGGMLGSGFVAATTDALVLLLQRPLRGCGLDRDPVVAPLT